MLTVLTPLSQPFPPQEVRNKLEVVLACAYPLLSQGLDWTNALDEKEDCQLLAFEVCPKYLPETGAAVAVTVCANPDVVVLLSRKGLAKKAIDHGGR
jgi:hypothetical protein